MNKNTKKLEPKLRFPEFRDSGGWDEPCLGDVCERITKKVGDKKLITVSITAGTGFVSQTEKFSRDISGKQYKNYIVLNKGEYSFNKGNSKRFPQGCIYKLKEFEQVAAPNAYISFRFKKGYCGDFFQGYFECNRHGEQLKKFISSGARSDGLLNINADDFFTIKFPTPGQKEQQKIADCLSSIDGLISAQSQKVEALKTHKKGLMQQLFPRESETVPRLRFPEFRDAGEWDVVFLNEACDINPSKTKKMDDESVSFVPMSAVSEHGRIEQSEVRAYAEVKKGYTSFIDGDVIIAKITPCFENGKGALARDLKNGVGFGSTEFHVFRAKGNCLSEFLFMQIYRENVRKMGTNRMVGNAGHRRVPVSFFEKMPFYLPSIPEQQKISEFLINIENILTSQTRKLETLKTHKKGLLQKLFPSMEVCSE